MCINSCQPDVAGEGLFFSGSLGSLGPDPKKHAKKHGFLWLRTPMAPILLDGLGGIPPVIKHALLGKKITVP
jgi:hypothetical protein